MEYNFERFTSARKRFRPLISIRQNGAIGLSQGALIKMGLAEGDWHVVLFYDRAKLALGIKPTQDPSESGAIKANVRRLVKSATDIRLSASIAAQSFFNYYGIPFKMSSVYEAEWNEAQGMLIAILSDQGKNEQEAQSDLI